jgi:Tfp pilus assembly protein PilE
MRREGRGALIALILLALVAAAAYTAYAGVTVYQHLDSGRAELVAAQASMDAASRSGDAGQLQAAAAQLRRAEREFSLASQRSRSDPALRLVGGVGPAGRQIDATARLAAIGADMSRAGEGAATIAIQVAALRQKYAGRPIRPADLELILQEAQVIARTYSASTQVIGQQLRAAHAERAQVTTTGLVPPLKTAYQELDRALAEADTAFLRYQDVRQVLSQFLGVPLPA